MWLLIECDDPVTGPGHDEKRRFVLPDDFNLTIADISNTFPVTLQFGSEMHPCTPGDAGYHCPICHKDILPATTGIQDEEEIIKAVQELRKEFEYMAIRKMFIMNRNKLGEYTSPGTFCLWAGYWECAIKLGIIPDKIEYINVGAGSPPPSKLQGRGCGEIVIDDNIDNLPKKKKKKTSDYTGCGTYEP